MSRAAPLKREISREDLIAFIDEVVPGSSRGVEERLGDGFVRLEVHEAERRQAMHDIRWVEDALIELLRNARDAHAAHIFVAMSRSHDERTLVVLDDAVGIPKAYQDLIFEARVTSKLESLREDEWGVHGRGMALYSIKERATDAHVAWSAPGLGSAIACAFDVSRIPERADQSSWPSVATSDEGTEFKGPKNLIRTSVEFALSDPHGPKVYLGSPSQIVQTMRQVAKAHASEAELLFESDYDRLPVCEQLLAAPDAATLARLAGRLGLELSERTAHRILSGALRPVRSIAERFKHRSSSATREGPDLLAEPRRLKLSEADALDLKSRLLDALDPIAERYFLRILESPSLRQSPGALHVTFRISLDDEG